MLGPRPMFVLLLMLLVTVAAAADVAAADVADADVAAADVFSPSKDGTLSKKTIPLASIENEENAQALEKLQQTDIDPHTVVETAQGHATVLEGISADKGNIKNINGSTDGTNGGIIISNITSVNNEINDVNNENHNTTDNSSTNNDNTANNPNTTINTSNTTFNTNNTTNNTNINTHTNTTNTNKLTMNSNTINPNMTAATLITAQIHNNTVDSRQLESASAMTAAVIFGAPLLAGALYAGATAPHIPGDSVNSNINPTGGKDFIRKTEGPMSSNRRQDSSRLPAEARQDEDGDFNWQKLFQRTVGNIRDTASYVEDRVLGFLGDIIPPTDRSSSSSSSRPNNQKQRRRNRPGVVEENGELRIRVPYIDGTPVFHDLDGIPLTGQKQKDSESGSYSAFNREQEIMRQKGILDQQLQQIRRQHQQVSGSSDFHIESSIPHRSDEHGAMSHVPGRPALGGFKPGSQIKKQELPYFSPADRHRVVEREPPVYSPHGYQNPGHHQRFSRPTPPNIYQVMQSGPFQSAKPIEQYYKNPETGKLVPMNSLILSDSEGHRRFDESGGLLNADGTPVRRFDGSLRSSQRPFFSSLDSPIRRSDSVDDEVHREKGHIRAQKGLGIEGLESVSSVKVIKTEFPGMNLEKNDISNITRTSELKASIGNKISETDKTATFKYVNKDGSVHFLELPKRFPNVKRLRKPGRRRQTRRKGSAGGKVNRGRNMKHFKQRMRPRIKMVDGKLKFASGIEGMQEIRLNSPKVDQSKIISKPTFSESGSESLLAYNHKYKTSSEERRAVNEYSNPAQYTVSSSDVNHSHERNSFLGGNHQVHSVSAGTNLVNDNLNHHQTVRGHTDRPGNYTTSFRVFNMKNKKHVSTDPGRMTFTQIYGAVKPESVLTHAAHDALTQENSRRLENHKPKQRNLVHHDLYGYRSSTEDRDHRLVIMSDPRDNHYLDKEDRFLIGGNLHRKIIEPKTLPPQMIHNLVIERNNIGKSKSSSIFRSEFGAPMLQSVIAKSRGKSDYQLVREALFSSETTPSPKSIQDIIRQNTRSKSHENRPKNNNRRVFVEPHHGRKKPMRQVEPRNDQPVFDFPYNEFDFHSDMMELMEHRGREKKRDFKYRNENLPLKTQMFYQDRNQQKYKSHLRSDSLERLHSVNLGDLSNPKLNNNPAIKIRPASFEVFELVTRRPEYNADPFTKRYPSMSYSEEKVVEPDYSTERRQPISRKKPPPLPRPPILYKNKNKNRSPEFSHDTTKSISLEDEDHLTTISPEMRRKRIREKVRSRLRRPITRQNTDTESKISDKDKSEENYTTERTRTTTTQSIRTTKRRKISLNRNTLSAELSSFKRSSTRLPIRKKQDYSKTNKSPEKDIKEYDEKNSDRKYRRKYRPVSRRKESGILPQEEMEDIAHMAERNIRRNQQRITEASREDPGAFDSVDFGDKFDQLTDANDKEIRMKTRKLSDEKRPIRTRSRSRASRRPISKKVSKEYNDSPKDYRSRSHEYADFNFSSERTSSKRRKVPAYTKNRSMEPRRDSNEYQYDVYDYGMETSPSINRDTVANTFGTRRFKPFTGMSKQNNNYGSKKISRINAPDQYKNSIERLKAQRDRIGAQFLNPEEFIDDQTSSPVSSFTSYDAASPHQSGRQRNRDLSIREKMRSQSEPDVITIDDVRERDNNFSEMTLNVDFSNGKQIKGNRNSFKQQKKSDPTFMKRVQDDANEENSPLVSNLKVVFNKNSPEHTSDMKFTFWEDDDTHKLPLAGSFVDPSGRMNNPVRSFNIQTPKPFSDTVGPNFGSINQINKLHMNPIDLLKKDTSNFGSVVINSKMSYNGGARSKSDKSSQKKDANSNIVTGQTSQAEPPPIRSLTKENYVSKTKIKDSTEIVSEMEPFESLRDLMPMKLVASRPDEQNEIHNLKNSEEKFQGKIISFGEEEGIKRLQSKMETLLDKSSIGSEILFGQSFKDAHISINKQTEEKQPVEIEQNKKKITIEITEKNVPKKVANRKPE